MDNKLHIEQDSRILYDFGACKYTVSEVNRIYRECKVFIDQCDINDLRGLYDLFHIKPKYKLAQSIGEITGCLAKRVEALANCVDAADIKKEVRKCRRKIYYWDDLPAHIYFINEKLDCCRKTSGKPKPEIEDQKSLYDCWIANACYQLLMERESGSEQRVKEDKLYYHKSDWEYVLALKHFSVRYNIGRNLEIDMEGIFRSIYDKIRRYGPFSFYMRVCKELYMSFDQKEKRIQVNREENTALPALLNYSIKALAEDTGTADPEPSQGCFQRILKDMQHAVRLLDVDNEHDLEFLIPSDESAYLERLMNYSALYDIHQYVPEGMLFLIDRIINAHGADIEKAYRCGAQEFRSIIDKFVRTAQQNFEDNTIPQLPFASLSGIERGILDAMAVKGSPNQEYLVPTQWDKVYSDSEWVIKRHDTYYVIPPVVSALGVYDKIGAALGWADFGPQIERAVLDLFQGIAGLTQYSGKYLFEGEVDECDAVIKGMEYALVIECKRKGVTRVARGGTGAAVMKDFSEAYLSSQAQAYRMQRAIEKERKVDFYPAELDISTKKTHNERYSNDRIAADFTGVKRIVRITCTGGSFWIAGEIGIAGHIENHLEDYKVTGKEHEAYRNRFIEERNRLLASHTCDAKKVMLDKLFLSFDKLYDIVTILQELGKDGDALLHGIWRLTRIQSKKNDTTNHFRMLLSSP